MSNDSVVADSEQLRAIDDQVHPESRRLTVGRGDVDQHMPRFAASESRVLRNHRNDGCPQAGIVLIRLNDDRSFEPLPS